MTFELGVFNKFRVVGSAGLHLGQFELTLPENAIVEFDGTTLKYGGGEYAVPALKGGVTSGWLVPVEDSISTYVPKPAGVRVKAAQSHGDQRDDVDMGTASEEETVVGDVDERKQRRAEAAAKPITQASAPPKATSSSTEMKPITAGASSPEMKPIEVTTTPGGSSIEDAANGDVVATVGQEAPEPKYPVEAEAGEGRVVRAATAEAAEEQAGAASPSADGEVVGGYQFSDTSGKVNLGNDREVNEAKRNLSGVSKNLGKPAPVSRQAKPEDIPETVKEGKAKLAAPDIKEPGPGGTTGDVAEAVSGENLETMLPDAASTGKPTAADSFEWSTKGPWRARVSQACKYADNPDVLRKILAVEVPAVQKHLKVELSKRGVTLD